MLTQDKLAMTSKQYGSLQEENPPMRAYGMFDVAWKILMDWEEKDRALTYLHGVDGQWVGIATRNEQGYIPTPASFADGVDGEDAVDWFNENILGHSKIDAAKIVLSSMR